MTKEPYEKCRNPLKQALRGAPPPEPEFEDVPVRQSECKPRFWIIDLGHTQALLAEVHGFCDFAGITYDVGFAKLNPYNPAIGTPISVRFNKEIR